MSDLQMLLEDADLVPVDQDADSWDLGQLRTLFRHAIRKLGRRKLTCFIDALDECDEVEVGEMLALFEDLGQYAVQNNIQFYVCLSSRHYPYIDIRHGQKLILENQPGHAEDLTEYVRDRLRAGSGPKNDEVVTEILRKASGVFMWVVLVVDILNKEYLRGRLFAVESRLQEIPSELSELFQNILTRDQDNMDDLLLSIQWLLYSARPLKREEYYLALVSALAPDTLKEWNPKDNTHELIDRFITSSSKGLAETTRSDDKTVQFIHESVRDFLLKDNGLRKLWPNMGDDFEAQSQDKLKDCCSAYFTSVDISAHMPDDEFLLKLHKKDAKKVKQDVVHSFPFMDYAINYILFHADAAAQKIPQDSFFLGFPLKQWVKSNNVFEEHRTRRHNPESINLLERLVNAG
ncbi:hypothetical protein ColLi_00524 [Colletotrichum liriopes]|uniref:KAP NTPase domain-containing protein n=1 Tax=Colletotrichum liriopes TaxID=708192 RepID=A0AA37GB62_9PEZI|nr:hypothetical protein ColLi_00524 [Colletotrichum liriopes]